MKLYLAVEGDALALPLAVCGSAGELAAVRGVKKGTILSMIATGEKKAQSRYIRLEVEGGKLSVRWCRLFRCPFTGHHFCCADCRRQKACPERCRNTPEKCGMARR